ncbi:hypothetical protein [Paenibacillus caui]|nr:hypothetical protein [Paenibacillus caui]
MKQSASAYETADLLPVPGEISGQFLCLLKGLLRYSIGLNLPDRMHNRS